MGRSKNSSMNSLFQKEIRDCGGRGGGVFTALGIASGQTIWAFATSLSIVALLIASAPLFLAVKYVGAAYLVYLGVQALREAARPTAPKSLILPDVRRRLSRWAAFRQGLLREDGDLLRQPTAAICRPRRSLGHGVHAAGDRVRSNDLLMAGPLCRRPHQTRGSSATAGRSPDHRSRDRNLVDRPRRPHRRRTAIAACSEDREVRK